jgi:flagellar basal-body rod protein FlgG
MFRSLYTAGWSMLAQGKSMDVISNNLANINTVGYKKDIAVFESFPEVLAKRINDKKSPSDSPNGLGSMQLGSDIGEIYVNFKQGQLTSTSSNLDMSLDGAEGAFFTIGVADANGNQNEYYTKNGQFKLDNQGFLVTSDGNFVLGDNGPIKVGSDNFSVTDEGVISIDGNKIDSLKITQFEDTRVLKKFGNNLITANPDDAKVVFSGTVRQGFVEESNVNTIREMVDMINILRAYEANQKVIQAVDGTMDKSVNEVGLAK